MLHKVKKKVEGRPTHSV